MPGTSPTAPSVLVIDRSACGVSVSVSVAVLFPGSGSVVPAGAVTVAVFASVPVAPGAMFAVSVNVAVPPGASVTVVLMLPVPLGAAQLDPGLADAQPRRAAERRRQRVGRRWRSWPSTGPAFDDRDRVGDRGAGHLGGAEPSVFVIDRSADRVIVVVSVNVLFAAVGSVMPPGSATDRRVRQRARRSGGRDVPVTSNVTEPSGATVTRALMLPAAARRAARAGRGGAGPRERRGRSAGNVSVTVALVTVDGPAFETVIVYGLAWPATRVVTPSVFDDAQVGLRRERVGVGGRVVAGGRVGGAGGRGDGRRVRERTGGRGRRGDRDRVGGGLPGRQRDRGAHRHRCRWSPRTRRRCTTTSRRWRPPAAGR